jgi:hypothetical protein
MAKCKIFWFLYFKNLESIVSYSDAANRVIAPV